jgi:pyruvate formate lyase activating enzyme
VDGSMLLGGIILSSLEYAGKISLVIFTGGCMLKCPYCHNPHLIDGGEDVAFEEIIEEIAEVQDFIDAIVITGGEPLIQLDEVKNLFKYTKKKGLLNKLDTNGYFPIKLNKIIKTVDYVALDIKAPFENYMDIIGSDIGNKVKKTMDICLKSDCFLECRTTYVPGLLNQTDVLNIAKSIKCDLFTLQQFRNRVVLDESLKKTPNPSRDELLEIGKSLKPYLENINIKTAEFGVEKV